VTVSQEISLLTTNSTKQSVCEANSQSGGQETLQFFVEL